MVICRASSSLDRKRSAFFRLNPLSHRNEAMTWQLTNRFIKTSVIHFYLLSPGTGKSDSIPDSAWME
jgi:hypothetical protein